MKDNMEVVITFACLLGAALGFGYWQHSVGAGCFVFFGFYALRAFLVW